MPLWAPRREFRCDAVQAIRDRGAARRMEEHNRLLYVALTRAEDRLVVCGWQTRRTLDDACWYSIVSRGFERLGLPAAEKAAPIPPAGDKAAPIAPAGGTAAPIPPLALATERSDFAAWPGTVVALGTPQRAAPDRPPASAAAIPPQALPAWVGNHPHWQAAPPPPEPARPVALAPSRPEGAELGPVPAAASPLADRDAPGNRFRRGQLIHALLQHLPSVPPAERDAAARRWLGRPGQGVPPEAVEEVIAEVLAILAHPALAPLFGPGSRAEVPLTGVVGELVVGGLVDRLAVLPDRVLVADFKTNRRPPADLAATPVLYLRQMAAYRAVLRAIFPGRRVRVRPGLDPGGAGCHAARRAARPARSRDPRPDQPCGEAA